MRNKKASLIHFVNDLKQTYDAVVLMLNDTRLNKDLEFSLPGFSVIRSDKNTGDSTSGGVAIAVPQSWDIEIVPSITISDIGCESVGVLTTPPRSNPIKLLSIYNHPQHHVPQQLFREYINVKFNDKKVNGFIGGDLNCPHEAFSSRFTNVYGTGLLNLVYNLNLIVLDNDEPTIYHHGEPNILDLFICEPSSLPIVEECYVGESIGSDHLPLITHTKLSCKGNPAPKKKTFFDSVAYREGIALMPRATPKQR